MLLDKAEASDIERGLISFANYFCNSAIFSADSKFVLCEWVKIFLNLNGKNAGNCIDEQFS